MSRLIDREVSTMAKVADKLKSSLVQEENDTHHGLDSLIKIYEECHRRLEESFIRSKEKIVIKFDQVRGHFEHMMF